MMKVKTFIFSKDYSKKTFFGNLFIYCIDLKI